MKIISERGDSKSTKLYYSGRFEALAYELAFSEFNHYQMIPQGRPIIVYTMVNSKLVVGYKYENLEASRI